MAEYTDGIERINIELSLRNKLELCDALWTTSSPKAICLWASQTTQPTFPRPSCLEDRVQQARSLIGRGAWLVAAMAQRLRRLVPAVARPQHCVRAGKHKSVRSLQNIFTGAQLAPILDECNAIHQRVLKGRVWVALHMHAGDGNVHTNIPVNSDNYAMLQTAHEAVARIMVLARSLDGVISGEHGIGITKMELFDRC